MKILGMNGIMDGETDERRMHMAEKKLPNLAQALEIKRVATSYFGDPRGFEEILFRTRNNRYVLVQRGGSESPYPVENIQQILKVQADEWLQRNA